MPKTCLPARAWLRIRRLLPVLPFGDMSDPAALVERIQEVCPLPASVQRVLAKIDDPKSNAADIAAAVGLDAGLTTEVLRIANSPAYGRPREVDTLNEAVMTLGLTELRSMAMSMAMLAAFASDHERVPRMHELSAFRGTFCSALSKQRGIPPAPAYLAGLLAEVGSLACLAVDPQSYGAILAAVVEDLEEREVLERNEYQVTSRWVGAALLRRNGLPDPVCEAVEMADEVETDSALACITRFARWAVPRVVPADGTMVDEATCEELVALSERLGCPLTTDGLHEVLHLAGAQLTTMVRAAS